MIQFCWAVTGNQKQLKKLRDSSKHMTFHDLAINLYQSSLTARVFPALASDASYCWYLSLFPFLCISSICLLLVDCLRWEGFGI